MIPIFHIYLHLFTFTFMYTYLQTCQQQRLLQLEARLDVLENQ